jgi:hypothetical protein
LHMILNRHVHLQCCIYATRICTAQHTCQRFRFQHIWFWIGVDLSGRIC